MRKGLATALFVAAGTLVVAPASFAAELLGYWSFDAGTVEDDSGNGHDGTIVGTVLPSSEGARGGGIELVGNGHVAIAGDALAMTSSRARTVALWARPEAIVGEYYVTALVSKYRHFDVSRSNLYALLRLDAGDVATPGLTGQGTDIVYASPATSPPLGEWHHYTFVMVPAPALSKIYRDGQLVASAPLTYNPSVSPEPLRIGASGTVVQQDFLGFLDEVRVYDGELTAGEIAELAERNEPPVALCQDVTVAAGVSCTAPASIDAGSYHQQAKPFTLSQHPPAPYGEGTTLVTLTVEDADGLAASCTATVTVVDETPPVVSCNAQATMTPPEAPIAFGATAADNCSAPAPTVGGAHCFAINPQGKVIDRSCVLDVTGSSVTVLDAGGVGDHIQWQASAADGAGHLTTVECGTLVIRPTT